MDSSCERLSCCVAHLFRPPVCPFVVIGAPPFTSQQRSTDEIKVETADENMGEVNLYKAHLVLSCIHNLRCGVETMRYMVFKCVALESGVGKCVVVRKRV